jgi:hypothetical protein
MDKGQHLQLQLRRWTAGSRSTQALDGAWKEQQQAQRN